MANVAIVTDGSAELPPEEAERLGIVVAPLRYEMGHHHYVTGEHPLSEFYRDLAGGETAQVTGVTADDFETAFREAAKQSSHVICICQSVGSSFTRVSAEVAVRRLEADGTAKVALINPGRSGAALGCLAVAAAAMAKEGADAQGVFAAIEHQSTASDYLVVVPTLDQIERAGQLSILNLQSKVGPLDAGVPLFRLRGSASAVAVADNEEAAEDALVERVKAVAGKRDVIVGFTHANAQAAALRLAEKAKQHLSLQLQFTTEMGPAAGSLFGAGAYGLGFCVAERAAS